jgi:hypothetical protein
MSEAPRHLSPETLQWLRDHMRLGDRFIFRDMEEAVRRSKQPTHLEPASRP